MRSGAEEKRKKPKKAKKENAALIICGSLYLAGEVRAKLLEQFS